MVTSGALSFLLTFHLKLSEELVEISRRIAVSATLHLTPSPPVQPRGCSGHMGLLAGVNFQW